MFVKIECSHSSIHLILAGLCVVESVSLLLRNFHLNFRNFDYIVPREMFHYSRAIGVTKDVYCCPKSISVNGGENEL